MKHDGQWLSVFVGVALGILAFSLLTDGLKDFNPGDAGLGQNTVTQKESLDGLAVSDQSPVTVKAALTDLKSRGHRVALWLGASQLHAVNNPQANDHIAIHYANQAAIKRGSDLRYVQFSFANAGLHDLLGAYVAIRDEGIPPDWLIVSITFDDLRELELKRAILNSLPAERPNWIPPDSEGVEHLYTALEASRAAESDESPIERNATAGTPQERLEALLTSEFERYWVAYRNRGKLLAAAQIKARAMMSRLMGAFMQRRAEAVTSDVQAWNQAALDAMLQIARADATNALLYKAPHRPGEAVFYHNRANYDAYFERLSTRCETEGVAYRDIELLVDEPYWGMTNEGRPDVFHFQDHGHRRLGAAIDQAIAELGG